MTENLRPLLPLQLADVPPTLRRILSQDGVPFEEFGTSPRAGRFVLFDSLRSAKPPVAAGQETIDIAELRRDFSVDPFDQLDDMTTARTWWQVGSWTAAESTARVDKGSLRTAVLEKLRNRIESRGGVWMRLAPVPYPYRSAFNFRFDHDEFVAADFHAVRAAITGYEEATTHFICAATHEQGGHALQTLRGCDVGSHGYLHHTYATFSENRLNIARGIESLRRHGFEPSGFAAPHGRFHAASAVATASLGITHGSEFAAAYDDRPYFPAGNVVLQLPIHPVCLGIVLEAAAASGDCDEAVRACAAEAVAEHFVTVAHTKRELGEPIFLYGHPDGRLGRYPQILHRVLSTVADWSDVWRTTLTEFQRWWRARATVTVRVYAATKGFEIRDAVLPNGFKIGMQWISEAGEASFALTAAPQVVTRTNTAFRPIARSQVPRPVRVDSQRSWRERLRSALDWEYVTPIEQIDVSRWQGRLKRSLRRWKARAA
jgi:hypothetical protein